MDDDKSILHAKRWDFYMNNTLSVTKGGYSLEVSGSGGKKVIR